MTLPAFPVEGGCQCGAVRYRLKGAPRGVYACYCKDCQRFSGTTHTLSMVVEAADIELIRGTPKGFDKLADSGRTVRMLGCGHCGARLWHEPLSSPGMLILKPGSLDDMGWAQPVGAIWTDSRPSWVTLDASGPNFAGQPATRQALFDAYAAELAAGGQAKPGA